MCHNLVPARTTQCNNSCTTQELQNIPENPCISTSICTIIFQQFSKFLKYVSLMSNLGKDFSPIATFINLAKFLNKFILMANLVEHFICHILGAYKYHKALVTCLIILRFLKQKQRRCSHTLLSKLLLMVGFSTFTKLFSH